MRVGKSVQLKEDSVHKPFRTTLLSRVGLNDCWHITRWYTIRMRNYISRPPGNTFQLKYREKSQMPSIKNMFSLIELFIIVTDHMSILWSQITGDSTVSQQFAQANIKENTKTPNR